MNKVKVTICGADYYLTTDEPVGTVQDAAARVDAEMRNLLNADDRITAMRAAILVALNAACEIGKVNKAADNLRGQVQQYLDDNTRLRREVEQLRQQTGAARPTGAAPATHVSAPEPESLTFFDED